MNFDRKSGNGNSEAGDGSAAFPELAPVFDERSGQFVHAPQHDFSGNEYPPGAFPALDVAYSGYNGDNNYYGEAAYGGGAGYNGAGAYAAEQGGGLYNAPDAPQNGYGQNGYGQNAPQQGYAEPQNSGYYDAAGAPPANFGGHDENFAEEAFHHGLSSDSVLQPAQFEPSDYDYAYDPQAEAAEAARLAAQREQAAREEAERRQAAANAAHYQHYQPQPYGGGQNFAQGYSLGSASYQGAYGNGAESGAQEPHYPPQNYAPNGQDYPQAGQAAPQQGFAQGGGDSYAAYAEDEPLLPEGEAPLPFADDEMEEENLAQDGNLANDLARLDADFAELNRIDALAGGFPLPAQENGIYVPQQGQRAAPQGAAPQRAPQQAENAQAAEANAASVPYDDTVYDWSAPPATPQRRRAESGSSKKALLPVLAVAALLAVGGGLYWFMGKSASHGSAPVIIHKAAGDYKVKVDAAPQNAGAEQSVSDGVSGGAAAQSKQKALIDNSENPLEMEKMNDRLPFSPEGQFDRSSMESLIKSAVAQAAPVHVVPSVQVDGDRQITGPHNGAAEQVLLPGKVASYSEPLAVKQAANTESAGSVAAFAAAIPPPVALASAAPRKGAEGPRKQTANSASGGDFYIQIASQPSREAAEQSLRAARKYLSAEAAEKLVIVPASVAGKGTYYRVRISGQSREDAADLCDSYKQAGGNCFIAR